MAAYGFFGDLLQDSEKLRWMGPKRYDCSGFKKFMSNRGYEGSVTFLHNETLDSDPLDNSRCRTGCFVCKQAAEQPFYTDSYDGKECSITQEIPGCKWKSIDGRFISVIAANMSCACAKSPEGLSPSAHLADGYMDLILIKHTSRFQYLRHMIRLASKADHLNFPFVDVFRVKEFHFKPLHHTENVDEETVEPSTDLTAKESDTQVLAVPTKQRKTRQNMKSTWNVDGESVEQPVIHVSFSTISPFLCPTMNCVE
ncbi:hypothetical protein QZH41_000808 [Actinostola sp. cb2023]|nr:hypothetical protein QZH41_000808 [Actinostola sp. cb2023]